MFIKTITSAVIAALLLTGTVFPVSTLSGQDAQPQQSAALTEAEAAAAALDHAGVTETEGLTAHLDTDDHTPHWDIQWRTGDWEYEYDIHSQTGAVLETDRDYAPTKKTAEPATEPAAAESVLLTQEEALAIALNHAGLTESQITRLQRELDRDGRRPEWEIEFDHNGWEYSYDIHAGTGEILDWEKEIDD